MPFRYYGGKKALARYYPPPAHSTIVEPFAGAAAYALWWWRPGVRVILVEKNPAIVATWHRLQAMSPADLAAIECPPLGARTAEPLITHMQAGSHASRFDGEFAVTSRMVENWTGVRVGLIAALPTIRDWEVVEGDYTAAPDVKATWFVDPPYAGTRGGAVYEYGSEDIDYPALGEWCQSRRGQVIVCEQAGADWLPFVPFRRARTGATSGDDRVRTEVVWTRSPAITSVSNRHARQTRADALARRAGRRDRRVVLDWDQPPG